ncbi:MAG: ATP-binding protein, partial [Pseudomonadota bacterium]
FYSAIMDRLEDEGEDTPSILFLNAQNKQTIPDIVAPLRSLGVPCAGVVDIDILKGGGEWTRWLNACEVPTGLRTGFGVMRGDLNKAFSDQGINMKTAGASGLASSDEDAAQTLFRNLAKYGMFVCDVGEMERWLAKEDVKGSKTDWTISILDKLGISEGIPGHVSVTEHDVWGFVRNIRSWIQEGSRHGMPS